MQRLSKPLSKLAPRYEAVVVGSGYGGGVAASRLARMGYRVALLERGREMLPGEYPDTPERAIGQSQLHGRGCSIGPEDGLFDLRVGADINVLIGCGLGGTSLINANVSIEADPRVFQEQAWPQDFCDSDLEEGFRRARAMLAPLPYPGPSPNWPELNKRLAMLSSAEALNAKADKPEINVTFEEGHNAAGIWQPACNLCGDCCSGCNIGAKNTTLMNYLPDAVAFGAEIFCGASVERIEPDPDGGWLVRYQPTGGERRLFAGEPLTAAADIVVLAAGSLGSTEILLRSKAHGLSLSDALGSHFSGNGDVLAFGYNNDAPIDGIGMGWKAAAYDWREDAELPVGPTITSLIDLRGGDDFKQGMIIEEGSIPGGLGKFLPAVMAMAARAHGADTDTGDLLSERAREIESLVRGPYHGAVNHTQTYLIMSHDDADGRLILNGGRVEVAWKDVGKKPGFKSVAANVRRAVAALGGTYVPNPIWTELFQHDLITVHPLGGCAIGRDASSGVVDEACRVFSGQKGQAVHPGLLVCDGAVMPRSLGVNPLLTIAAVAERAMIKLARERGKVIQTARPPDSPKEEPAPLPIGIRFTEKMTGTIRHVGSGADQPCEFVLTICAADLDRLIAEKDHVAELVGTISLPGLAPAPLTVLDGSWNLFIDDSGRPDTKRMVYRMPIEAPSGKFIAMGEKLIHDDAGPDLWADTTTLSLKVREGWDDDGDPVGRGELRIEPQDFIRQMRTMTVTAAPDFKSRITAMGRFGLFFAGNLFQSFGGPFAEPLLFDPKRVRVRRPLRAGTPEIHFFETEDGKKLRFTRYNGGDKGPLILAHGLGVSSLIFTIDTIDTSLLEYLHAAGYDCWLLDFRASIELPYATEQFTADDVATKDFPSAVEFVRTHTAAPSVQVLAHCYGAMCFSMAMLASLKDVRSAVISQISAHADVPFFPQRLLAYLHAPDLMAMVGATHLDARATTERNLISRMIDGLLRIYPFRPEHRTRSATSRRITAIYGPLYEIAQLNQATLDAMPEMFGKANISAMRQLSKIARAGHVVPAGRGPGYLGTANLRNFAIPTLFVHGELNRTFLPSGTRRTIAALSQANGAELYERHVVPGTGHIDCIFGKDAVRDVYPRILAHLDQWARVPS